MLSNIAMSRVAGSIYAPIDEDYFGSYYVK